MAKQLQFVVLFLQTFIDRHKKYFPWSILIGFFLTLLIMQIYPLYISMVGKKHDKIGVVGRFDERNLPLFIQNQISLGLTMLASDGEATASLAKSWEVDEKGTTYTFHLLPDINWHDGKKFTARDINYRMQGVTFEPVNETTLKVTLKEVFAPLPVFMSRPISKPNLNGLGIYKVIRLLKNGETISEMTLKPQDTKYPTLTYKFYPNLDDALLAFKMGEINILKEINNLRDIKTWKNVNIKEITRFDRFTGIFFNLNNVLFKEKEVRQALAYALPKIDDYEKAYSPISPLSWAYSKKIRLYNTDLETATKMLSKSPLASASAEIVLSTYANLVQEAQTVADNWKKAGLNVKVKVENTIPADYQIFLLTQMIPPDPDQYSYWQSTQEGINITSYSNPKIDKLLEDGRKTLDKEARIKIYADFQRYLVDDSPVIFLYFPKVYQVERK